MKEQSLSEETEKMIAAIDSVSGNNILSMNKEDVADKSPEELIDLYANTALFHYMSNIVADGHFDKLTEKKFNALISDKEKTAFKDGFKYGLELQFAVGDNDVSQG